VKVLAQVLVGMHVKTPVPIIVLTIVILLAVMDAQTDVLKLVLDVLIIVIWVVKEWLTAHIVQDVQLVVDVLHNVRTTVLPTA